MRYNQLFTIFDGYNPEKTDGGLLVSAKDCLLENAFNEMMLTKNQYHKTQGRQPNESWYTKPLSELEGQALKEALIKLKLGKGYDLHLFQKHRAIY